MTFGPKFELGTAECEAGTPIILPRLLGSCSVIYVLQFDVKETGGGKITYMKEERTSRISSIRNEKNRDQ
jgi:hypothetical protein